MLEGVSCTAESCVKQVKGRYSSTASAPAPTVCAHVQLLSNKLAAGT